LPITAVNSWSASFTMRRSSRFGVDCRSRAKKQGTVYTHQALLRFQRAPHLAARPPCESHSIAGSLTETARASTPRMPLCHRPTATGNGSARDKPDGGGDVSGDGSADPAPRQRHHSGLVDSLNLSSRHKRFNEKNRGLATMQASRSIALANKSRFFPQWPVWRGSTA
jgi:hypothetical protein